MTLGSEPPSKDGTSKLSNQEDGRVEVINLWSGPRSLSTSLMYSFAQRDDTEVLDEPLYAHYLHVTGAERPYRDEVIATGEIDGSQVIENITNQPSSSRYRFCKHIAKHRTSYMTSDLSFGKHVILIRDPLDSLVSFDNVIPASLQELQVSPLLNIFMELSALGHPPPVIDAKDLQQDPEGTLKSLCAALSIPFQASMLEYTPSTLLQWVVSKGHILAIVVHMKESRSCGKLGQNRRMEFGPHGGIPACTRLQDLKHHHLSQRSLLECCQPFYNILKRHALRPTSSESVPPPLPVAANKKLLVWVGDQLVPREDAKVSVFDSIVQGGDGVWEGLRIYKGKIFKLEEHLDRLFDSAKAMAFTSVPSRTEVKNAIFSNLIVNGMRDSAHIRLTLTRGKKVTSGMSPGFNLYGSNLLVVAEWKPAVYDNTSGIRLITASTRRNSPNCLDSKIHHNNLINNILAKVEGNLAGVDDAIMLDCDGFVSETNATNLFMVKKGRVLTPHADHCLPGITRATVIGLVKRAAIPFEERRISLTEFHVADEVWTTGTMGELSPVSLIKLYYIAVLLQVVEIDGRMIGNGKVGPITQQLQQIYASAAASEGEIIPDFQGGGF